MKIDSSVENEITIIAPDGRLDAQGAVVFEQYCKDCIAKGVTAIIIDLSTISYISSAGLRSALIVGKLLNEKTGSIVFCNALKNVYDVFVVSGFATIFKIFQTKEEALGSYR